MRSLHAYRVGKVSPEGCSQLFPVGDPMAARYFELLRMAASGGS